MRQVRPGLWVLAGVATVGVTLGLFWNAEADRDPDYVVPRQGPFTEHEWLTGLIVRDLGEAAWLAAGRLGSERLKVLSVQDDPRTPRVRVTLSTSEGTVQSGVIETRDFVWSPRDYSAWATALLASNGVAAAPPTSDDDGGRLLEVLLEPTAAVLERENQRISEALERDLRVAERHEEAALLQGAFALREAAGLFSDTRPLLSRMAAHLAFARALQPEEGPGIAGAFAEVVLLALAGRQVEALRSLDTSAADERAPERAREAWTAALRLRLTSDWRASPPGGSLLERREHYRALVNALDPLQADRRMARRMSDAVPDWRRINLERVERYQQARRIPEALEAESAEVREVWAASRAEPFDEHDRAFLDEVPDGGVGLHEGRLRLRVLHWADWAAAFQRHTSWLVYKDLHLEDEEARPELATERSLGRLFPLLQRWRARSRAAYQQAMPGAVALVTSQPQLVTAASWLELQKPPGFAPVPPGIPSADAWFGAFPAGTTYDARYRMTRLSRLTSASVATVEQYRALAPYDYFVSEGVILHKYPVKRTGRDVEREYAERSLYDPWVMRWIAKCCADDDPELYRQITERLCRLEPTGCVALADYVVDMGLDELAALAYQQAFELGLESEDVSEGLYWLVQHHYERGDEARALRVARAVAATGSTGGMETLGLLYEQMGRLEPARAQLRSVKERHGNSDRYMQFTYRHGPRSEFEELTRHILPDGLEPVGLSDLQGAPADGIRIENNYKPLEKVELPAGAVVVAIDGFRVRSAMQYHLIRGLNRAPDMTLIVWNRGAYKELRVATPRRLLGAAIGDYVAPES